MRRLAISTIFFVVIFRCYSVEQSGDQFDYLISEANILNISKNVIFENLNVTDPNVDKTNIVEELKWIIDDCLMECNEQLFKK